MRRRIEWQKVLDSEVKRWSVMSCTQLASELHDAQAYEVEFGSKHYQVEVELLENTERYLHVLVSVDDGSLPASISPLTHSFVCHTVRDRDVGLSAVTASSPSPLAPKPSSVRLAEERSEPIRAARRRVGRLHTDRRVTRRVPTLSGPRLLGCHTLAIIVSDGLDVPRTRAAGGRRRSRNVKP
jgi:hypothetical protein